MRIKSVLRHYENTEHELLITCTIIFLERYEFSMFIKSLKAFDPNVFRNRGDSLLRPVGTRYLLRLVCRDNQITAQGTVLTELKLSTDSLWDMITL